MSREASTEEAARLLPTLISPLIDLGHQLTDLTIRELRKNKVELLFLSTGSFWFSDPSPAALPRQRTDAATKSYPRLAVDDSVLQMASVRQLQARFATRVLQKASREDHYEFKRQMSSFEMYKPPRLSETLVSSNTFVEIDERSSMIICRGWVLQSAYAATTSCTTKADTTV